MKYYEKPVPKLTFSKPDNGENPDLEYFDGLYNPIDFEELPVKDDCPVSRRFRVLELPPSKTGEITVHVYNAAPVGLRLRTYNVDGGRIEVVPGCREFSAVVASFTMKVADGYDGYLLRFDIVPKKGSAEKLDAEDYFAVAAYDGRIPESPGGIRVGGTGKGSPSEKYIPFSHNGRAFQRIVVSTCDPTENIRDLVGELDLEIAEKYVGEMGSVVALGVPPGMSLNTTIDTTTKKRQRGHQGDGTVSMDYLVNLFSPDEPSDMNEEERWEGKEASSIPAPLQFSPPPPGQFDCTRPPLTLAIIDSGIDYSKFNAQHWEDTRYRDGPDTEYITPGKYGYDFISGREEPMDEAPHGTYVAATILNQYRAEQPLQLLHMKVFGKEGIASYFGSLVSIFEATAAGARIINMSWGIYDDQEPRALYCALKTAAKHGVLMVTSAGNDEENLDDKPQWPAAFADDFPCNLITVASYRYGTDDQERVEPTIANLAKASYTNWGIREVPLAAFYTSPVPKFESGDLYFPTGTSISAPIVAGLLASWLADNPNGTLAEFRKSYYHPTTELETVVTNGQHIRHDNAPLKV